MSRFEDEAQRLRDIETPHYNCCQSVVMAFADEAELGSETACRLCANLGGGLKRRDAVCGSILGGLIVLGLFGVDDAETVKEYYARVSEEYGPLLNCAEFLATINPEDKQEKKRLCDGLVKDSVLRTEALLREKGRI